jgi:hypothetical protein
VTSVNITAVTNTVTVVEGDTTVVTVTTAGPQGAAGANGAGVASGGTTGQALVKTSNADFATGWTDISSTAEFAALAARVAALEDLDIMLLEG